MPAPHLPVTGGKPARDRRVFTRHAFDSPHFLSAKMHPYPWRGEVLDLSAGGVRFRTPLFFQPGWLLSLELLGPTEERSEALVVEVVHTQADAGNSYLVGSAFVKPLSASQLEDFLHGHESGQ